MNTRVQALEIISWNHLRKNTFTFSYCYFIKVSSDKNKTLFFASNKTLVIKTARFIIRSGLDAVGEQAVKLAGGVGFVGCGRTIPWHPLQLPPHLITTTEACKWKCQHFQDPLKAYNIHANQHDELVCLSGW